MRRLHSDCHAPVSKNDKEMAELDSALEELRTTARRRHAEQERRKLNQPRNNQQSEIGVSCGTEQPQTLDARNGELTAKATSSAGDHIPVPSRFSQLWRAMIGRIRH